MQSTGMARIELGSTGRSTSRLGFGCSSLMGAIGRKESLALLEQAFEAGIRHFDVAPMYGFGAAEGCLGEFLDRHRSDVTVATKYGIPPVRQNGLVVLARRTAGTVVKSFPGLKQRLSRAAHSVSAPAGKASFSATEAKASLAHSLAELRTDRIDLLLLHEAEAADLTDEGLLRFLEECVAAGTIGTFGVGSSADKIPALLAERPGYCPVLQFEWSVLDKPLTGFAGLTVHHRALTENFQALHAALSARPAVCKRWSTEVNEDLARREVLASLMLKAALVMNPGSLILFSSRNPAHIRENVRIAADGGLDQPARKLYERVQAEGVPSEVTLS